MANIYIIDNIRLNKHGLQTKDANGSWIDLHCQQGTLDGACAVYSAVMALLCLNYLGKEDIDIWNKKNPDRRTAKGKFISHLLDENGLVRDGYRMREMAFELKSLLKDYVVEHISKPNCIYVAKEYIEAGFPVILSVGNEDFCHAILAIGTEYKGEANNEKLLKLLCLDPAYGISPSSYWNCVIDTSRNNHGDYPFTYITDGDVCKVRINELITLESVASV